MVPWTKRLAFVAEMASASSTRLVLRVINGLAWADGTANTYASGQPKLIIRTESTEVGMAVGNWPAAGVRVVLTKDMCFMRSPSVEPVLTVCRQRAVAPSTSHRSQGKRQGRCQ